MLNLVTLFGQGPSMLELAIWLQRETAQIVIHILINYVTIQSTHNAMRFTIFYLLFFNKTQLKNNIF